ncbi:hypothetical protein ACFV2N_15345 [Streptomyces sp. NPDC059680]|uniref:hypothetical protein n=1 Tax=Streptomyces sp. NPDC059680 TaxID=3346904 RepID=UPI00367AFD74
MTDFSELMVSSFSADAKTQWPTEVGHFTPWVISNLGPLGEQLGLNLTFMGREVPVGDFRADVIACDDRGRRVVIENQFGPTDHGHFGQIVVYACAADADVIVWVAAGSKSWCGPSFRAEHVTALTVLNSRFKGVTEFYGVEVSLESDPVRLGEMAGPLLPRMRIVAQPELRNED